MRAGCVSCRLLGQGTDTELERRQRWGVQLNVRTPTSICLEDPLDRAGDLIDGPGGRLDAPGLEPCQQVVDR